MYKILKIVTIIAIVIFLFGIWTLYSFQFKKTEIARFEDDKNKYTIVFKKVGSAYLFSSNKIELSLKDEKGKIISSFKDTLANDGASVSEANIKVNWHQDYVEVILSGYEQQDKAQKLYFEK